MGKDKESSSSQIFADFTISRIDSKVRRSMSPEQLNAIRDALVASKSHNRHALDLRLSIPLFIANFYLVILGGRDKRRSTVMMEMQRSQKGNVKFGFVLTFLLFSLLAALVWGGAVAAMYLMKVDMGVDLFSNFHFSDLFN